MLRLAVLAVAAAAAGDHDDVAAYLRGVTDAANRVRPCNSRKISPGGRLAVALGICVYIDPGARPARTTE